MNSLQQMAAHGPPPPNQWGPQGPPPPSSGPMMPPHQGPNMSDPMQPQMVRTLGLFLANFCLKLTRKLTTSCLALFTTI